MLLIKLKYFPCELCIVWVGVIWLGFVMLVIFYGFYHGKFHPWKPPFGIILALLPSIKPIGSMYGIFTYIYHINHPNVGKYTIHGLTGKQANPRKIGCSVFLPHSCFSSRNFRERQKTTPKGSLKSNQGCFHTGFLARLWFSFHLAGSLWTTRSLSR